MSGIESAMKLDQGLLDQLRPLIDAIAKSYGLAPAVVGGVLSRESGAGRLLGKGGNPPGTGDRGHGRGLMQIDDRFWKGLLNPDLHGGEDDAWRYPAVNIAFGGWLLHNNLAAIKKRFPNLKDEPALRAALASYNCGLGRTLQSLANGRDVDAPTAGGDYSRDVMVRAEWLRQHGWN